MKINIVSEFNKKPKAFKITAAVAAVVIVVLAVILYILTPNIPASSISFKNTTIYLQPGMTIRLSPEIIPYNTTKSNLEYRCSDNDIVTVNDSIATALKEGEISVYCLDKTNGLKSNIITVKIVDDISELIKGSTMQNAVSSHMRDDDASEKTNTSANIKDADTPQTTDVSENETESAIYVYCSPSGKKYHTESCKSSGKNPQKVLLAAALEEGLEPCLKCKP